jgi:hypothetical protein
LHVGIAMRQPLDHTRHGILGTTVFPGHLVAHVHDILPVLGGEILVSCLGYERQKSVSVDVVGRHA